MNHTQALHALIQKDEERKRILSLVASLDLPDCWIAAGFVRNAVWDATHGRLPSPPSGDVDIIWFDLSRREKEVDQELEARLRQLDGSIDWSVKNQSRMHTGNGDQPYRSSSDAMRYWPETATATAIRSLRDDELEISAPFGLDDLYGGIIRPTPRFGGEKRVIFDERVARKQWLTQWPLLRIAEPNPLSRPSRAT
jgi:hypothetical protein